MKKVNDSLSAIQGGFTPSDEIAVFTYADGVNNPTDFNRSVERALPAVLEKSKKPGEDLGAPITSDRWQAAPRSTAGKWIQISPRSAGMRAFWSTPKRSIPSTMPSWQRARPFLRGPREVAGVIYVIKRWEGIAQQSQLPRGGALP